MRGIRGSASLAVVTVVFASVLVGAQPAVAQPANDDFADAVEVVTPFEDSLGTNEATTEDGEPQPSCAETAATVWYEISPESARGFRVDTFGSKFDTVLGIWEGASLGTLTEVACNDDAEGLGSQQSEVSFVAEGGKTYYVQVGGFEGASGLLELEVTGTEGPLNDFFEFALPISSVPFTDTRSTEEATTESGEPSGCFFEINATVWYTVTPDDDLTLEVDTFGSDFDTVINVYRGSILDDLHFVACNDQADGTNQSRVVVQLEAGRTYAFQMDGWSGSVGQLVVNADVAEVPANDDFAQAEEIESIPFLGELSTLGASLEPGEDAFPCAPMGSTVWYRYSPDETVPFSASTLGSEFDTVVAIYEGESLEDLQLLACNDDQGGLQSMAGFVAAPGETYYVQVGGYFGDTGDLRFRLSRGAAVGPVGVQADEDEQQVCALFCFYGFSFL